MDIAGMWVENISDLVGWGWKAIEVGYVVQIFLRGEPRPRVSKMFDNMGTVQYICNQCSDIVNQRDVDETSVSGPDSMERLSCSAPSSIFSAPPVKSRLRSLFTRS